METRKQRRLEARKKWKEEGKKESFTEFWDKQPKTEMISKLRNRKQRRKVVKK
jgi:hypothetical protein